MVDSDEDISERVTALFKLLKKKNYAKIKEVGEQLAEDASDDEPYFEPAKVVEMVDAWLDACINKADEEVLKHTADILYRVNTDDYAEHPGLPALLRKVSKALSAPNAELMEDMIMVRIACPKISGDPALYPAVGELLMNPRCGVIHDTVEGLCERMYYTDNITDPEAEKAMSLCVDIAQFCKKALESFKPGDKEATKLMITRLKCLSGLVSSAHTHCGMLVMTPGKCPKAEAVIAQPTLFMGLQEVLDAAPSKPKELREVVQELSDHIKELLGVMPKPKAGTSKDPVGDAKAYVKNVKKANDPKTLTGIMNSMMSSDDSRCLDVVLSKDSLEAVLAAFKRIKKDEYDESWQTMSKFFSWAVQARPKAVEAVGDPLVDQYMQGSPTTLQPRAFVEALTQHAPSVARKMWQRFDAWVRIVSKSKGSPIFDGCLYAVVYSMDQFPKVLEGQELEGFCKRCLEMDVLARGGQMEDGMKCTLITGLKAVVRKDKSRLTKDALDWTKALKEKGGNSGEMAASLIDIYEGRSLEGAYDQIDEANKRFGMACGDLDTLKRYVDENVKDLKEFVGGITKKLPVPTKFSSERRLVVRMAMLLHFECQAKPKTRVCGLPSGTFKTETLEWDRWLKIGLSAAKLGKTVLTAEAIGDLPGAVDQVKEMYKAYSQKDDKNFLQYISEPFLTSEEQDKLILQLRKAAFFKNFGYDAQTGSWLCLNCLAVCQRCGPGRTAAELERHSAALEDEVLLPLDVGGISQAQVPIKEQAMQAKDAAMKVKEAGSAWFGLFGCCKPEKEVSEEMGD